VIEKHIVKQEDTDRILYFANMETCYRSPGIIAIISV